MFREHIRVYVRVLGSLGRTLTFTAEIWARVAAAFQMCVNVFGSTIRGAAVAGVCRVAAAGVGGPHRAPRGVPPPPPTHTTHTFLTLTPASRPPPYRAPWCASSSEVRTRRQRSLVLSCARRRRAACASAERVRA